MAKPPRSADMLVNLVMSRPGELQKLQQDPEMTLRDLAKEATKTLPPPPLMREAGIYYIVVISLGLIALAGICGSLYITLKGTATGTVDVPDVVTALGSAAIGALAGLLSPSPKAQSS